MIGQTMSLIAAFLLGSIFTEFRWIGRMSRLRGLLGLSEAARMYGSERATLATTTDAAVPSRLSGQDTQQSLRSLQQHLTDEAQPSPVPETATKSEIML